MKKYILFGTGSGGHRVLSMLKQFSDIEVFYCLDNYPKEDLFEDIPVIKAGEFLKRKDANNYYYCIASVYRDEITQQLLQSGIKSEKIFNEIYILIEHLDIIDNHIVYKQVTNNKNTVVFDLSHGFYLGGIEKWTYNLSSQLIVYGKDVKLLSNNSNGMPPENLKQYAMKSKVKNFWDYKIESIQYLVDEIESCMPCTVFIAHISSLMIACILLKIKYPEQIKIISVVHGGLQYLINDNQTILCYVDNILCVSYDIYKILIERESRQKHKILFKETPVNITDIGMKKYSLDRRHPIKIAYAARLEKLHKHSELIIPFVEEMERKFIPYTLDIAGDGGLFQKISDFVNENKLSDKINMLGQLDYKKMENFWLEHDIAVNMSECEGCSLAMLESMSAGDVPVFTDVSSTRHFIKNGLSGFIVDYNDIEKMVSCIEFLEKNRERLAEMGRNAHNIIAEKCKIDEYVKYLLCLL